MEEPIIHEELMLLPGCIKTPICMLSIKINDLLKENNIKGDSVFIHSNCYSVFIYFKNTLNINDYKYKRLTLSYKTN